MRSLVKSGPVPFHQFQLRLRGGAGVRRETRVVFELDLNGSQVVETYNYPNSSHLWWIPQTLVKMPLIGYCIKSDTRLQISNVSLI